MLRAVMLVMLAASVGAVDVVFVVRSRAKGVEGELVAWAERVGLEAAVVGCGNATKCRKVGVAGELGKVAAKLVVVIADNELLESPPALRGAVAALPEGTVVCSIALRHYTQHTKADLQTELTLYPLTHTEACPSPYNVDLPSLHEALDDIALED